jgi:hypothetical protein
MWLATSEMLLLLIESEEVGSHFMIGSTNTEHQTIWPV